MNDLLHRAMYTVAALLAATVALPQWHFRLDTTFRTSITEKNVNYMAFLPTGDLLLSGRIRFQSDPPWVSADRYLTSVDTDGEQVPSFPYGHGGGRLTPWEDRFYVGTGLVRRLDPNGLLDETFIHVNTGPYFSSFFNGDYHVYPDGRVLMSGMHTLSDTARGHVGLYNLIWFSNEGYLDTTRTHRAGNGPLGYCTVHRFTELPNGQFICSSNCNEFEGKEVDWIFRVNADGTPDTTFRTGVHLGSAYSYLPLVDGRVYVGGRFYRSEAPADTLTLVRFMPDGSLDPSFTIPHIIYGQPGWTGGVGVSNIQPWMDGSILITGQFKYVNGQPRRGICLLDSTGQLLDAFHDQGVGIYQSFLPYGSIAHTLYDTANAHLYICGAYVGYNDGTINDPTQRFVSRLIVEKDTGTTSVGEVATPKPPALRLYPNPANGWVSMNYHLPGNAGNAYAVVRDVQGRVLQQFNVRGTQGQHAWDVQGLAPGVYMVELRREGRVEHAERLVIQP